MMIKERGMLVEKVGQKPEYDGEAYFKWLFSDQAGREIAGFTLCECKRCLTINLLNLPVRYGKCRCCELIHFPT
jgi:hypothetical protein